MQRSITSLDVQSLETEPCGGVVFSEAQPFQMVTVRKVPTPTLNNWTAETADVCP